MEFGFNHQRGRQSDSRFVRLLIGPSSSLRLSTDNAVDKILSAASNDTRLRVRRFDETRRQDVVYIHPTQLRLHNNMPLRLRRAMCLPSVRVVN